MSTPNTSVDSSADENSDSKEEDRILKLLKEQYQSDNNTNGTLQEELKEFKGLSSNTKLKRLDELVKRSQLFSSIIADTLLESSLGADPTKEQQNKVQEGPSLQAQVEPEVKSRPRKKPRTAAKKKGAMVQSKITDIFGKKNIEEKKRDVLAVASKKDKGTPNIGQPKMITGCRMKDYQVTGMEWLITLYQNGLNGILADEMGLGKTLQSISMLAFLYEQGITGPFLVCCPLSTVSNWISEFQRFAPGFKVMGYVGTKDKRAKMRRNFRSVNVVVTSYEISIRDFKYLSNREWKYLIVDEGHRLKNAHCLLIRQLKRIRTSNRLLLTGTPLQNNLDELWSLLNFILPEIFHDVDMFQQWFDFTAFENLKDESGDGNSEKFNEIISLEIQKTLVQNLHTILRPFLLRRLKKDVIKGLPPKREYIIYSKLSDRQQALYEAILSRNLKNLLYAESFKDYLRFNKIRVTRYSNQELDNYVESQINDDFPESKADLDEHWKSVRKQVSRKKLQNVMMQLRLVCDSPYLFFFPWNDKAKLTDDLVSNSCKLQVLDQLIPRLIEKKHKMLIFSQFTGMLDILEEYLSELRGIECYRLDGSTNQEDRETQIASFNSPGSESSVFLLSTRAGGLGINMTAADTVIMFDSDWNPQVDLQAMDRVHRIGQTKPVVVYRLVCAHTIEEFLLAKADSKRRLERLVIQLGDFHTLLQGATTGLTPKKVNSSAKVNDELLENLRKFWGSKEIKTKELEDNRLTDEELEDILDRSEKAYGSAVPDDDRKSHISLFETVSAMA
ncbi:DEKNAAC104632 [Brettanomyces naardenensis]|uniref:DEKNAAC104632 n=1 Tax=Brettanomyces naardenensis TaxID=13370 RepID=A0A448YRI1_BRENA|nr:DEKNAAC104632 [Brettanomyces naardenensis]